MVKKRKEQFDWQDEEQEEIIWVSKSEIKRDAEMLKQLGEKLVNLTKANLEKIPLPENILDAIELAQRVQKEAKRRQLQYIGKLLRQIDTNEIQESLSKLKNNHHQQQDLLHKLELLRADLLEKGDSVLNDVINKYPMADRQHLRNLIRTAQKERMDNKPQKAYREIFQYLKELIVNE